MTEQIAKDLQAILNRNNASFAEEVLTYAAALEKAVHSDQGTRYGSPVQQREG